jgi:hypothetical protein
MNQEYFNSRRSYLLRVCGAIVSVSADVSWEFAASSIGDCQMQWYWESEFGHVVLRGRGEE